jgi:hypothetical protein
MSTGSALVIGRGTIRAGFILAWFSFHNKQGEVFSVDSQAIVDICNIYSFQISEHLFALMAVKKAATLLWRLLKSKTYVLQVQ